MCDILLVLLYGMSLMFVNSFTVCLGCLMYVVMVTMFVGLVLGVHSIRPDAVVHCTANCSQVVLCSSVEGH